MNIVPRRNTPVTAAQARAAVLSAYRATFGTNPGDNQLALLLALVWIETARGASVQNFNLGNISAGKSYPNDAWRPPWFDLEGGTAATERNVELHEAMLEGRAPEAFRAYPSLEFGALDFVRTLKGRFPEVLAAAATGDATAFRDALAQKYSRDYRNTPPENFASLAREFGGVSEPGDVGRDSGHHVVAVLVIAGMAGALFWATTRGKFAAKRAPVRKAAVAA